MRIWNLFADEKEIIWMMYKMAIIINSLYTIGGEERVVSIMANEFSKYYEVTIISAEARRHEKCPRNSYYLEKNIKVILLDEIKDNILCKLIKEVYRRYGFPKNKIFQEILKRIYYPKDFLNMLQSVINAGAYDLVITISGNMAIPVGIIRNNITAKCIDWEHGSYEGYFGKKLGAFKTREELFSKSLSQMDKVVVLNEDIKNKYMTRLGIEAVAIPNPKSFDSDNKVDVNRKMMVTCGRIETEKGYDDLVEAFAVFHKSQSDWNLRIIGGGRLEGELRKRIHKLNMDDCISISGYTGEVKKELLKGSIFVMTSRFEGFPMTITEALEIGLPVIAYGIPALQPLITNGVEGCIVPPFDRQKLVDSMLYLARNEEERKKMSISAIEKAKQLNPEVIYNQWESIFNEVLSK